MINNYPLNNSPLNDATSSQAMIGPDLTFRYARDPYEQLPNLDFYQIAPDGTHIPVRAGEKSEKVKFRIYNNAGLMTGVASAFNVQLTAIDGAGSPLQTKPVATQDWTMIRQTGFGEGGLDKLSYYDGDYQGLGVFAPTKSSNGSAGAIIRAGNDHNGMGFIELEAWLEPAITATSGELTYGILLIYEWI